MKIINIGSVAPPVGGVTSFIQRLRGYLEAAGCDVLFFDTSGIDTVRKSANGYICCRPIQVFIKVMAMKKSIVMFHSPNTFILLASVIMRTRHTMVLWAHGSSTLSAVNRGWKKRLFNNFDYIITPTEEMKRKISQLSPKSVDKITVTPFILFSGSTAIYTSPQLQELKAKTDHVLCVYAYKLLYYKGKDLYGLDMSIELIKNLRRKGYNVGLVMLLPDVSNKKFYRRICNMIVRYEIEQYVVKIEQPMADASELYRNVDIYIRPSNIDGDAFSIWESLHVGTPVLASDAVSRPQGCLLFENRNDNDFCQKASEMLDDYSNYKRKAMSADISRDSVKKIVEIICRMH